MSDIEQKLHDYLEGTLDAAGIEELKQRFIADPEFQNEMVELTVTERLLKTLSEPSSRAQEIVDSIRFERESQPMAPFIKDTLIKERQQSKMKTYRDISLIAASFFFVLWAWTFIKTPTSGEAQVFKVVQSIGAQWNGNHPNNKTLKAGSWHLKSGILKLASADGSQFILEGPANFEIGDDLNWKLYSGKVYGDINKNDRLSFSTPDAEFDNMGEKFAMQVLPNQATQFQMLEGKGSFKMKDASGVIPTHQWVSFSKDQGHQKQDGAMFRYLSTLPQINVKDYKMHHWSFDHVQGNQFTDHVIPPTEVSYPATWQETQDPPTGPVRINGIFGDAIQLNGQNQFLTTDWPGIGGTNARTVAFGSKSPKTLKPAKVMASSPGVTSVLATPFRFRSTQIKNMLKTKLVEFELASTKGRPLGTQT